MMKKREIIKGIKATLRLAEKLNRHYEKEEVLSREQYKQYGLQVGLYDIEAESKENL